jgi:hypothetical protein
MSLPHWRARDPPWRHPRSCVCLTGQARNDRGQITTSSPITSMGKSCWSLCHPYWHYTHDPSLRGIRNAALGHYSLERSKITPWFTPPRPRSSTPVKPKDRYIVTEIITTLRVVATSSTGLRMAGHVATASKDKSHSSNSNTPPTTGGLRSSFPEKIARSTCM